MALTIFFSSCSKENVLEDEAVVASLSAGETLVTDWENGYSWKKTDSADFYVFSHERIMPGITSTLLEKGAVLVALRNVPYKEDSLRSCSSSSLISNSWLPNVTKSTPAMFIASTICLPRMALPW